MDRATPERCRPFALKSLAGQGYRFLFYRRRNVTVFLRRQALRAVPRAGATGWERKTADPEVTDAELIAMAYPREAGDVGSTRRSRPGCRRR